MADDLHVASDFARREASEGTTKARDAATVQKNFLADRLGGVATAMEKVAAELEAGDNRDVGVRTRKLSANLRNVSESRIEAFPKSRVSPRIPAGNSRSLF